MPNRSIRRGAWRPCIPAMLLVVFACWSGAGAGCEVQVQDERVTLDASSCSLISLLEDLGGRAGFEVIADASQDSRVTVRFENLTVDQAIRRIVGKAGYLEVTDPEGRTTRVVLTSKATRLAKAASKPYEPLPAPPAPDPAEETDADKPSGETGEKTDETADSTRQQGRRSRDKDKDDD